METKGHKKAKGQQMKRKTNPKPGRQTSAEVAKRAGEYLNDADCVLSALRESQRRISKAIILIEKGKMAAASAVSQTESHNG